jgi:hypothetical protein
VKGTVTATAGVFGLSNIPFSVTPTFDASQGDTMKLVLSGDVTSTTLINALPARCQPWFYLRLMAYGFFGLSERALGGEKKPPSITQS